MLSIAGTAASARSSCVRYRPCQHAALAAVEVPERI